VDSFIGINKQKNGKKLDLYGFVTFYDFLSLKDDVNVPSIRNKLKKTYFCLHLKGH
jgi:hypothetical protein